MHVQCVVAGCGPAGMMLGLLLARARVSVLVLDKQADFLRDFRGHTIHPSTLGAIYELGILEAFLLRHTSECASSSAPPGLLCIGDAAHAMSPIGGVGINLAIQDAVAAPNILAGSLPSGTCNDADLARVQRQRELPTGIVQRAQVMIQKRGAGAGAGGKRTAAASIRVEAAAVAPILRRIPARLVGMGVRPEYVRGG